MKMSQIRDVINIIQLNALSIVERVTISRGKARERYAPRFQSEPRATRPPTIDILNLDTIDNLYHWQLANGHNSRDRRDSQQNRLESLV